MKQSLLLFICIIFCTAAKASHTAGAYIYYNWKGGMDYEVSLEVIRDCGGTNSPYTLNVVANSVSLSQNITIPVIKTDSLEMPSFCPQNPTNCTSLLSTLPGFYYHTYKGMVTLPGQAADWVFSYNECCRNSAILNINTPSTTSICVKSRLNNVISAGNNSVKFTAQKSIIYNGSGIMELGGLDIDGDSVAYTLMNVSNGCNALASYNLGYNNSNLGTGTTLAIINGDLVITGTPTLGQYFIAIQATEYDNTGAVKAEVIKEIAIVVVNQSAVNAIPSIGGINGSTNYVLYYNACAGNNINFTLQTSDADVTDSTRIEMIYWSTPSIMFSNNGNVLNQTGTFSWSPTTADVSPTPYLFTFQVYDNKCPMNGVSYANILIYVNQCNIDTVWPGDANADFVVNNFDVLNIGLSNGATGTVRPSASTNWSAQYCPNWGIVFANSADYKHADCDGNGTINTNDLSVVTLNYGQFHVKNPISPAQVLGVPKLKFDLSAIPYFETGKTYQIPIVLGDAASTVVNTYGIAANIVLENGHEDLPLNITKSTAWLFGANDIEFNKNIASNNLDMTLVRSNQTGQTGYGIVGHVNYKVSPTAPVGGYAILRLSDVKVINNMGVEQVIDIVGADSAKIGHPLALGSVYKKYKTILYPNPAKNQAVLHMQATGEEKITIELFDITGRKIETLFNGQIIQPKDFIIPTAHLQSGTYSIQISSTTAKQSEILSVVK